MVFLLSIIITLIFAESINGFLTTDDRCVVNCIYAVLFFGGIHNVSGGSVFILAVLSTLLSVAAFYSHLLEMEGDEELEEIAVKSIPIILIVSYFLIYPMLMLLGNSGWDPGSSSSSSYPDLASSSGFLEVVFTVIFELIKLVIWVFFMLLLLVLIILYKIANMLYIPLFLSVLIVSPTPLANVCVSHDPPQT